MSLHIRLFTNFWTHRKTAKLRSLIQNDAFWIPARLWSYAADNQPDGDFSDYSAEELALLLGYQGDAQALLQALQQACFMDGMKLHNWEDRNGYHHSFSERAKNAANARWKGNEKKRNEKKGKETSIAPSIASSITEPKKKSNLPDEDWIKSLKENYSYLNVDQEMSRMKGWLSSPKGKGRSLSRNFIINWLNRCDKPVLVALAAPEKKAIVFHATNNF